MGRRPVWLATGMLAAVLTATPVSAGPERAAVEEVVDLFTAQSGPSNRTFIQMTPPEIKRYEWYVTGYKETPRAKTALTVAFFRQRAQGTQTQTSEFVWELPRGAMKVANDLRPAAIDTRKGLGNNGSIDMRLTRSGHYLRVPAEEGCTGHVSIRVGRFGGRFRFNARDDYFKRISMRGVQAFVYREDDYSCPGAPQPAPACPGDLSLNALDEENGVAIGAFKTPEGRVDQTVAVVRALDTGQARHTISVRLAVPEAFEASDELTTASLDGDAGAPWLSGDLSYVAPPGSEDEDEQCGPYRSSEGIATGDYTAHFDSIGDVTPATTGLTATLRREI